MKIKNILIYFALLLVAYSCKEDAIDVFTSKPLVNVSIDKGKKGLDTTSVITFGFDDVSEYSKDTVMLRVYISGVPTSTDRVVALNVTGATKDVDYVLPTTATIKASEVEINVPCVILRSNNLVNEGEKRMIVNVVGDNNFNTGINNTIKIIFSDDIPSSWVNGDWSVDMFLGTCSKAKYKFFYDMLGFYDLKGLGYAQFQPFSAYLNQRVADYNADPGLFNNKYGPVPMVDENGNIVKFN